jgi:hypothetical protein
LTADARSDEKDAFQDNLHRIQELEDELQEEHVQKNDLTAQLKTVSGDFFAFCYLFIDS